MAFTQPVKNRIAVRGSFFCEAFVGGSDRRSVGVVGTPGLEQADTVRRPDDVRIGCQIAHGIAGMARLALRLIGPGNALGQIRTARKESRRRN